MKVKEYLLLKSGDERSSPVFRLSVGFEQGICAKLNAVAVNCIGNSGSAKHYAGDFPWNRTASSRISEVIRIASGRMATKSQSEEHPHSF